MAQGLYNAPSSPQATPVTPLADIEAAARNVYAAMNPTPQYAWPLVAKRAGCEVWVKHENHTPTGAFKVRGGLNLLAEIAASGSAPSGTTIMHRTPWRRAANARLCP